MISREAKGESSKKRYASMVPPHQMFSMHSSNASIIHVEISLDPNNNSVVRIGRNPQVVGRSNPLQMFNNNKGKPISTLG